MFFWKRKKKELDFESKMGELNTTVLSKKDYKNTGKKLDQKVYYNHSDYVGALRADD